MTEQYLSDLYSPLTDEEKYLKGLFLRRGSPEQQAAWRAEHDPAFVAKTDEWFLLNSSTEKETLLLQESELFSRSTRSIVIRRHSRYSQPVVHMHTFFEIFYVLKGHCFQAIEGRSRYLQKGDLCFIAPYVRHSVQVESDDCVVVNILVRRSNFEQLYLYMLGQDNAISHFFTEVLYAKGKRQFLLFHLQPREAATAALYALLCENNDEEINATPIKESLLMCLCCYLMRSHPQDAETDGAPHHSLALQGVSVWLWNNMGTATLESAAAAFHFSPSRMSHLFHEVTGCSFSSYLKEIRLNRACVLLQYTEKKVDDICREIGLSSTEYFYRAFKKQFGTTPNAWRLGNRGKET